MKAVISSDYGLNFVVSPMTRRVVACENIRFSSLFVAGDVSRGGTSATQRQKFHTDDANQCLHNKSGSHGVPNINSVQILRHQYGISAAESQTFLLAKRPRRRRARRNGCFRRLNFMENANKRRRISLSLSELGYGSWESISKRLTSFHQHLTK